MKILIYGAGVIGSLYAVLFSKNENVDVSIYARGAGWKIFVKRVCGITTKAQYRLRM